MPAEFDPTLSEPPCTLAVRVKLAPARVLPLGLMTRSVGLRGSICGWQEAIDRGGSGKLMRRERREWQPHEAVS
jgi:hypothetical protein